MTTQSVFLWPSQTPSPTGPQLPEVRRAWQRAGAWGTFCSIFPGFRITIPANLKGICYRAFLLKHTTQTPQHCSVLKQIIYISCSSLHEGKVWSLHSAIGPRQPQAQAGRSEKCCISPLLLLPTQLVFRAVGIPHCGSSHVRGCVHISPLHVSFCLIKSHAADQQKIHGLSVLPQPLALLPASNP